MFVLIVSREGLPTRRRQSQWILGADMLNELSAPRIRIWDVKFLPIPTMAIGSNTEESSGEETRIEGILLLLIVTGLLDVYCILEKPASVL